MSIQAFIVRLPPDYVLSRIFLVYDEVPLLADTWAVTQDFQQCGMCD